MSFVESTAAVDVARDSVEQPPLFRRTTRRRTLIVVARSIDSGWISA
jgi:hypothetical protein